MPSKESKVLEDIYKQISSRGRTDINEIRTEFLVEGEATVEPTDVTYEEVNAGGRPALWAKPLSASSDRAILYFHGGGFATCNPSVHRKLAAHLAKAAGARALVLDYRLAPENPFPAQLDDAINAWHWLLKQGFAPNNIATAGDSAGGNLSVTTALKLMQDGQKPPAAIISFSPWVDMETKGATLESKQETDVLVKKELLQNLSSMFLGGETSPTNPLANPLHADLTNLPPLFISVGLAEVLLDDSLRLAERAKKAGVHVELEQVVDMQHVHVFLAGRAPEADTSMTKAGNFLKQRFGK